jgi:copper(I)-binding protein
VTDAWARATVQGQKATGLLTPTNLVLSLAKDTTVPLTLTVQDPKGVKSNIELKLLVGSQPPAMSSHDHSTHNHGDHKH